LCIIFSQQCVCEEAVFPCLETVYQRVKEP